MADKPDNPQTLPDEEIKATTRLAITRIGTNDLTPVPRVITPAIEREEEIETDIERAGSDVITIGDTEERVFTTTPHGTFTSMYKGHAIVRACIDKIAKSCVAAGYKFIPRDSKLDLDEGDDEKLTEVFTRSKFRSLLRSAYIDLLIYGDAFWWVQMNRLTEGHMLLRVAPSQVSIVIDKETQDVTSYIVRDSQGQETQYPAEDFIHFKFYDPSNAVYGLSPMESIQSAVAQDLFAQQFNESFYANGAQTGIIFNMKGASKEEVDRNREYIRNEYTSVVNAHKPVVLEGDVSVEKSASDHAGMQFIEGRQALTMEIMAVFDMPYTKIGGTTEGANRSQSSENDKTYRSETIAPLQNMVEDTINEELIFELLNIQDTIFNHVELDTRTEEQQMKLLSEGMSQGVYALNDVRQRLGLAPVEGGEEPWVATPTGLIPVSMVKEVAEAILAGGAAQQNDTNATLEDSAEASKTSEEAAEADKKNGPEDD